MNKYLDNSTFLLVALIVAMAIGLLLMRKQGNRTRKR